MVVAMEVINAKSMIAVLENKVENVVDKLEEMRVENKEQHASLCSKNWHS
jgi:hypothetical protein